MVSHILKEDYGRANSGGPAAVSYAVATDDEVSHWYLAQGAGCLMRELWVAKSVVADCWQWVLFQHRWHFFLIFILEKKKANCLDAWPHALNKY